MRVRLLDEQGVLDAGLALEERAVCRAGGGLVVIASGVWRCYGR